MENYVMDDTLIPVPDPDSNCVLSKEEQEIFDEMLAEMNENNEKDN